MTAEKYRQNHPSADTEQYFWTDEMVRNYSNQQLQSYKDGLVEKIETDVDMEYDPECDCGACLAIKKAISLIETYFTTN